MSQYRSNRGLAHGDPVHAFELKTRIMQPPLRACTVGLVGLLCSVAGQAAPRYHLFGQNIQLACTQPVAETLACDYRLLKPVPVLGVAAHVGDVALPRPDMSPSVPSVQSSAILLLVDTSDPARKPSVELAARHIRSILTAGAGPRQFGLATFDSELELVAPMGTASEKILSAARSMRAGGRTTELYRTALQAVQLVADVPSDRRAIFLFSDGLAEDQAYFHEDVIERARDLGVVLFGLGYPRSESQSVALQSLRRLAEETGGLYLTAGDQPNLPPSFLDEAFNVLENRGGFTVDLTSVIAAGFGSARTVDLRLELENGEASARIPIQLPPGGPPESAMIAEPPPAEMPADVVRVAPTAAARDTSTSRPVPAHIPIGADRVLWYAVGAVAILTLLVLALVLYQMVRSKKWKPKREQSRSQAGELPVSGYLEMQDGSGTRHAINASTFRIGRHVNNDLTIQDPSVSRQHAEVYRRQDGRFVITDLDSMNGIFVNNKQEKQSELVDGDIVELGDITLRFITDREGALADDRTVMLRTPDADSERIGGNEEKIA